MYRIAVKKNASTMEEKDMVLLSKAEYNMAVTSSMKYNSLYVNVSVAGNTKKLLYTNEDIVYFPNGLVFGGTAASAGLVTKGICGVTTPDAKGACSKDNLYLNYDGNDSYSRPVVLGAGSAGNTIASSNGAKMYSAVRGDQMVAYVKSYLNTSGGVTINNDHSAMQNLDYEHSGHTGFASSAQLDTEIKARRDGDDSLKKWVNLMREQDAQSTDEVVQYNVKQEAERAKKAESANEARIATLEKKNESLTLRNNELAEIVGKEMDYQFSEYTTKEATESIPSVIGERSVVGNDDTRGLVASIGGRTEYSRNLFSGTWTKGTGPTGDVTIAKNGTNSIPVSPSTTYTISLSATNRRTNQIYEYDSSGNYLRCLSDGESDTFNFTTSEDCHFIRVGQWTPVAEGMTGYPAETMLVKGGYTTDTMPSYVPYYTGLKSVENPKLKINGNGVLSNILTDSSSLVLAGVDDYHDEIKIVQKDNGLFRVELHKNFRIARVSKNLIAYGEFRQGGASTGGEFGADNMILEYNGDSRYHIKSNLVQHLVCDILDPIHPDEAYHGTKQGIALVGNDGVWIYVNGLNSADEYIEWLQENKIYVGYPIAGPTITTLYDDLSLADVSFLQKAGYVITAENDNTTYAVNPSVTLRLVTKGVKA